MNLFQSVSIPPATQQDRTCIIRALIQSIKRNDGLDKPVIEAMLHRKASASPLYLTLLVQWPYMLDLHDLFVINSQRAQFKLQNKALCEIEDIHLFGREPVS